ncbi:hypothetical protein ASG12_09390 [Williamsia sp. Leaf354]|uniref:hypothetical protein n=1 Tax=Williamsia sp. Leaf354 TaxID=1736349 RepID=UPI0006F21FC6|nr:hypothetical protein [Williamsia sp. Leaf354]KQR98623.1 hypothetical protein ASG12_09390 [Williamsia sp. Leaf354]
MIGLVIAALVVSALAPVPQLLGLRSPTARRLAAGLGVIGLIAAAIAAAQTDPATGFARGLVLVLGVTTAATGAIALVPLLFDIVRDEDDRQPEPDPDNPDPDSSEPDDSVPASTTVTTPLRGGRLIGVLERTAVAAAVLAGWPEGIAVVLAVKGLARYPEIRAAHAGEQFIIGTFGSVLWALAVAGTAHLALH